MGNLIRWTGDVWDPFETARGLQDDINRLFSTRGSLLRGNGARALDFVAPDVDVKDEKDHWLVKADLPGIKKDELNIAVEGNRLTIRGERKKEAETKEKGYYCRERFEGSFIRSLELPTAIKADRVKASYKDGVLEISLPKTEEAKPKEIKVEIQ